MSFLLITEHCPSSNFVRKILYADLAYLINLINLGESYLAGQSRQIISYLAGQSRQINSYLAGHVPPNNFLFGGTPYPLFYILVCSFAPPGPIHHPSYIRRCSNHIRQLSQITFSIKSLEALRILEMIQDC